MQEFTLEEYLEKVQKMMTIFGITGDFFEEWNKITPHILIRKFKEITV